MFPYQIYQALTEQRTRELMAEARHHELVHEARLARRGPAELSSGLRVLSLRLATLFHPSARAAARGPRARSAMTPPSTSASNAGPMGCNA
jgi:hypothetical protein